MSENEQSRLPASKSGRHGAIETILATQAISSQTELQAALEKRGIYAAQATLSRDLLELRATKVRDSQGRRVYALGAGNTSSPWSEEGPDDKLQRWAQDLLVGAATSDQLVILRTPAGAANLLGSAIDAVRSEQVLGTVAGDDTIMVVCASVEAASDFCEQMLAAAEGVRPDEAAGEKHSDKQ
ncbi:MAG: arginine repressor [Actinomycetaceae bacterium]|nr:arginine repressor [Actinomycetaceae bacterium]